MTNEFVDRSSNGHSDDTKANGSAVAVQLPSAVAVHSKWYNMNVWNKLRYNFNVKRRPSFNVHSPVWLLGKLYIKNEEVSRRCFAIDEAARAGNVEDFLADFQGRIWLTYRSGFPPFPGTNLTTDCGWGCTLRCGQMLLAETLCRHHLTGCRVTGDQALFQKIVTEFADTPDATCSIHCMVDVGGKLCGKLPGHWYGPASTALLVQSIVSNSAGYSLFASLEVYVVRDGVMLIDEVEALGLGVAVRKQHSSSSLLVSSGQIISRKISSESRINGFQLGSHVTVDESRQWVKSVLILIPLRLGTEKLNPVYIPHLKTILSMKYCVGIIGGRLRRAMFYAGWNADSLICMDPHYSQKALHKDSPQLSTCHCKWPKQVLFTKMDPNCTVGFYIPNRSGLQEFLADVSEISTYGCISSEYPLFSILSSAEEKRRMIKTPIRRSYTNLAMSTSSISLVSMT